MLTLRTSFIYFPLHTFLKNLRKTFELFIYLGKYGLCTIAHIMTQ